jgi:hypothetical protein
VGSAPCQPNLGFQPVRGLTCRSIRIATLSSSTSAQTLENLLAAIPPAVAAQKGGWDNILSLGIKTSTSVQLPIWAAPLDGRFDLARKEAEVASAEKEKKGAKRKSVFDLYEEEEQAEEKRAKAARGEADDEEVEGEKKKSKKGGKRGKGKKATGADGEMQVDVESESAPEPEIAAEVVEAPTTKEKKAVAPAKAEAAKGAKKAGKKSSTIGSGGAGKKAKEAITGKKA